MVDINANFETYLESLKEHGHDPEPVLTHLKTWHGRYKRSERRSDAPNMVRAAATLDFLVQSGGRFGLEVFEQTSTEELVLFSNAHQAEFKNFIENFTGTPQDLIIWCGFAFTLDLALIQRGVTTGFSA